MSENAEAVAKAAKKAAKKNGAKKTARKAPAKKRAKKVEVAPATERKTRGRPAGKKTARKVATNGRRKKPVRQFAYMLLSPDKDNPNETKASQINGPFGNQKDALDDASIMADDTTTIVLFREVKRGKVQKSTKFVAGR